MTNIGVWRAISPSSCARLVGDTRMRNPSLVLRAQRPTKLVSAVSRAGAVGSCFSEG